MADITRLSLPQAARLLASTDPAAARGFLGLDPVTQNSALLVKEMTLRQMSVHLVGDALYGHAPNPHQPRQAFVAATEAEPAALRAFLGFLAAYRRHTSYVALLPDGSPVTAGFEAAGFVRSGTLPDHAYRSGRYGDVAVYHATRED
ncbi:hypothetical protein [Streptomyces sp. ICBB 8177]|uniref:hypothetical protein n=1 Tax=Streptomyces sp. ICBB 8177 TaxID=563922 RepID=UPI000D68272E|nr:hypothetical protein [Streptomyces sp. ICBB 8177]PWI44814.1 hypothetical protein CK485_06310 [Streptomyces sp. ICBB 8177]